MTDGEPNFYGIATNKGWLLRIQINGELQVPEQIEIWDMIQAAPLNEHLLELYTQHTAQMDTRIDCLVDDLKAMQSGERDVDLKPIIKEFELQQVARQARETWGNGYG